MNRSSAWLKFGNLLGHKWCHPITKFNFVTFPLVRFPSFPQALAQKRFWGSFQGQNGDSMGCDHTSVSLARFMFISHQSWALKISFQEERVWEALKLITISTIVTVRPWTSQGNNIQVIWMHCEQTVYCFLLLCWQNMSYILVASDYHCNIESYECCSCFMWPSSPEQQSAFYHTNCVFVCKHH